MTTISLEQLRKEVDSLWERQHNTEKEVAVTNTNLGHIRDTVDRINGNISKLVWLLLTGVVMSVLNLVLR